MKHACNFCSIFFLLAILPGCSHKTFPAGNYQQTTITADGDLGDWGQPIRFVSTGGLVLYNVTNDDSNLYVGIETHDEATALKILRAGIDIYIDPTAGEHKSISLAFPLANTSPLPASGAAGGNARPDKNELREALLIQAISFNTTGFKNIDNGLHDVSDKSKIKVAMEPGQHNGLGYEAIVPLQYIFGDDMQARNAARNLSVGIVINAMKGAENYRNRNDMSGGGAGHHGGGRGRGMGGSGGGGNYSRNGSGNANNPAAPTVQAADRTAMFKADANWYTFKLAVKK